jgi:copper(I)-binding protein
MALAASCGGQQRPTGGAAGQAGDVSVWRVVAWPTADMATLGLRLRSERGDALVGVTVAEGTSATLHTTGVGGAGMSGLAELALPAGREVVLTAGGPHVMIMGLERQFQPGDSLTMVFRFRRAGELPLRVPLARYSDALQLIGPP